MKSVKLYKALKELVNECVDEMGLPKKPNVVTLYRADKMINRYEKEQKRHERQIPPPRISEW